MNGSRYAKKHDVNLFQKQPEPGAFHFQRHQNGVNTFVKKYLFFYVPTFSILNT